MTQRLTTEIVEIGKFTVVERSEMKRLLDEQKFQYSGCVDVSCAVEIGKLLGAKSMVVGTVSKLGKTYSVDSRLIDVKTAENYVSAKFTTKKDLGELLIGMRTIAYKICEMELPENLNYKENYVYEILKKNRRYGFSIGIGDWKSGIENQETPTIYNFSNPYLMAIYLNFNKPFNNLQFEISTMINHNFKMTNINFLINKNFYIENFNWYFGMGHGLYDNISNLDENSFSVEKFIFHLGINYKIFSTSIIDLSLGGRIGISLESFPSRIDFRLGSLTAYF